ncbi:hypothetical protein AB0M87_29470 [Streptomyces sp. NPDC051320]|uniref:hypothetical protein n=1 Tax=Streptomyces sp. NPDC051320 TaxID=3154644 RepID=UPI003418E7CE
MAHDEEVMLGVLDETATATLDRGHDTGFERSMTSDGDRRVRRAAVQRPREAAGAPVTGFP